MRIPLPLLLVACDGLVACNDKGGDSGTLVANITLTDDQNYNYSGDMTVPIVQTASGVSVEICWSDVDQDIQCHAKDPVVDLDNIGLARFGTLTEEEVETGLETNELLQRDNTGYVEYNTDHSSTCAQLEDFSFFGTPIDLATEYTEEGGTYLLMLTEGTEPGVDVKMITFLDPRDDSDNTRVDIEHGCGVLDFTADLESLETVGLSTDGPWVIDWSGLTRDGFGSDLRPDDVTSLNVGFYEGKTPAELATQFLDLEIIPTNLYSLSLTGGNSADLAAAVDADGNAFSGLSGDGTWLLALRCGRCYNPAPVFLSVLVVE
ncbi:MAG: hypothetical protein H6742_14070 [Alphaproteobacteria bacterium]|nr:hypothetical protein [Alphaproteobacteria bacterium]